MIIERVTFQAKYGQGDALVGLIREWSKGPGQSLGMSTGRLCTDLTGTMFTLTWDTEYPDLKSLAEVEEKQRAAYATKEFQDWFARMVPLVERGERQLLNVVDL